MIRDYYLTMQNPLLVGGGYQDITDKAYGWRRSIRGQGGYWLGDFEIYGTTTELISFFYEKLAAHIEEYSGGFKTWEGLIYEMEFTNPNGLVRRASLETLYNRTGTVYIDENNVLQETSMVSNNESKGIYGQKEELLYLDGFPSGAAQAYRDTILREYAWPYPKIVAVSKRQEPTEYVYDQHTPGAPAKLTVVCVGYSFTGNYRYESAGDNNTGNLDVWISDIISTDFEFIRAGSIATNTTQVKRSSNTKQRAWDQIESLVELGDASGNPHRVYVENDRYLTYEKIDTTPVLFVRNGLIYTSAGGAGQINPYAAKPSVARDMDYSSSKWPYDGWLTDSRDFWIDEVEVQSDGTLILKTDLYDESEILAAQMEYQNRLSGESSRGRESSWRGRGGWGAKPVWVEWGIYDEQKWTSMSHAAKRAWKKKWSEMSTAERKAHRSKYKKKWS